MLRAPVLTVDCELVGQGCGGAIQTSGQEHGPATKSAKSITGPYSCRSPARLEVQSTSCVQSI